ncbi:MAG: hypothetical protein NT069_14970, partial [Planctomycetota bacterium]|nr:hypothetical protein [Planctomycetota bacterium]
FTRGILCFLFALSSLSLGSPSPAWSQSRNASRGQKTRAKRDIAPLRKQYTDRQARFHRELEALAEQCAKDNLPAAADTVRELAVPFSPDTMRVADLPKSVLEPLNPDLPPEEKGWRVPLRQKRQDYAKELFALSQKVLAAGHFSFAWDLIREVAHHDPDNPAARKALGFVRTGDDWMSPFEAKMLREHKQWDDRFGWVLQEQIERLKKGERLFKSNWISSEREAEIRRDFAQAWEVRTEHYLVRTNHSLERGVELAKKLEEFHGLFLQALAGFFNTPEQFKQLLAGTGSQRAAAKPLVVHYYATRDEYITRIKRETTQKVELTRGIYFPKTGVAHFFYDPQATDDSTLYHEATHQLLSGARPAIGEIGMKSDFWSIEGIACYMESFQKTGETFSFGDPQTPRFHFARQHFLVEKYYVPIASFSRMGMVEYQNSPEIKRNYAQGASLVHFFLHHDDGQYRDEFVEYLSQIYSPTKTVREKPESLWKLIGVESDELDQQYAEYVRKLGIEPLRTAQETAR